MPRSSIHQMEFTPGPYGPAVTLIRSLHKQAPSVFLLVRSSLESGWPKQSFSSLSLMCFYGVRWLTLGALRFHPQTSADGKQPPNLVVGRTGLGPFLSPILEIPFMKSYLFVFQIHCKLHFLIFLAFSIS